MSSLKECEYLPELTRPAWRSEYVAQTARQLTKDFGKEQQAGAGFIHIFLPESGDAQRRDGEHIVGTGNGNHVGILTKPCIAIAIFC